MPSSLLSILDSDKLDTATLELDIVRLAVTLLLKDTRFYKDLDPLLRNSV